MIPNLAIINYIDNYNDAGVIKDIDFIWAKDVKKSDLEKIIIK
jgi:hypothetical protein